MDQGHSRPGSGTDQTVRTRYLRAMASNAGAVPWNNGADDGEEGADEESVGETASIDMPELSEGREVTHPRVPHLLSDLSDRTFSPRTRHLDLGRSQSLSSVGLGSINNVRVSRPRDGLWSLVVKDLLPSTSVNPLALSESGAD